MPGHVHCWVVESQGQPVAACVFFECGEIVQAHLGGTRSEFLNKSPFHLLLHWRPGGRNPRQSSPPLGRRRWRLHDPLLQFKRGFSQLLFPFSTLRLIIDERKYRELMRLRARALMFRWRSLLAAISFLPIGRPLSRRFVERQSMTKQFLLADR